MRTTIDMPDHLSRKLKRLAAEQNTTMRSLILHAIERSLVEPTKDFRLRNASAGDPSAPRVDADTVNEAVDAMREPPFHQ